MSLEKYLGRKVNEITWVRDIGKFISAEQYTLRKYNLPLIDYLVIHHNEKNRSLRDFEKELKIYRQELVKIFDNLGLPRPNRIDSMKNKYNDPVEGPKIAQGIRDRYKDPEYAEKMRKAIHDAQSTPEAKALRSELSKKMWANPEFYKRVMPKVQAALHKKWQNDHEYVKNVLEGVRKFNQNPELRQKANKKLSELGKARFASDPKYAERSRKQMKDNWANPDFKEMMLSFLEERAKNPEYIEKMRQSTLKNWQDPQFREKTTASIKGKFENDPEYREKTIKRLQSPEMKARVSESSTKRWQNLAYKARMSKLMSEIMTAKMADPVIRQVYKEASDRLWADPDFRKKFKKCMEDKWENDKEYREKITNLMLERWADNREDMLESIRDGIKEFWKDPERVAKKLEKITPEQRERSAERMRQVANRLWSDPEFRKSIVRSDRRRWRRRGYEDSHSQYLPTYSGFRRDIGFNAKSSWEANIARILIFCGREFVRNFPLEIVIEEEYEQIFEPGVASFFVDFISTNKKNVSKTYEIVSHYFENPIGVAKAEMLLSQYPNMPIRIINAKTYERLKKHFKDKINEDPRFIAWEDKEYNIKTNPEDFGVD